MLILPKINISAADGILYEGVRVDTHDPRAQSWIDRGWAESAAKADPPKPRVWVEQPPAPEFGEATTRPLAEAAPPPVTKRRKP